MSQIELTVVIPAYLEEENLRLLLPRIQSVLREKADTFEVLVVDTAQPMDNTRLVCEQNSVTYVSRVGGNTYGDAVRTGIACAQGKRILFMDADGSHTPEFILQLLPHGRTHDIVVASRYIEGGTTENPQSLIWMSRALNLIYSAVLGIRCHDVSNSFKLYHGDLLRRLALHCDNFDVVEEILVKCAVEKPTLTIKEVPTVFKARMFGRTKRNLVRFVFSFGVTLLRLVYLKFDARRRQLQQRLRSGRPS